MEKEELVCVLCGTKWHSPSNRCRNPDCGGFCSWGEKKDGPPSSWDVLKNGAWVPKPVPKEVFDKIPSVS